MKKEDWIDYFEAVNGRSPSAEEYMAARNAGEFFEEKSENVSEPVHYNTQPTASAQPNAFTIYSKEFWQWLVSAWKSPTSVVESNAYNGYLFIGFLSLFYALIFLLVMRGAAHAGDSIWGSLTGASGYYISNSPGFGMFFFLLLAAIVYFSGIVISGFVAKRIVFRDDQFTFNKAFEWYGRLLSFNLPILAVALLFSLIGYFPLVIFLVNISLALTILASVFAIAHSNDLSRMDMFYKYIVAVAVNSLVMFIFILIDTQIVWSYMGDLFRALF